MLFILCVLFFNKEVRKMKDTIVRATDGELIQLGGLSDEQLLRLRYEEEKACSLKAKNMPPFSDERREYLRKVYTYVEELQQYDKERKGIVERSMGVDLNSIRLVLNRIRYHQKKFPHNDPLVVFEAGCGYGNALERIAQLDHVQAIGCDVYLTEEIRSLQKQNVIQAYEGEVYTVLEQLKDESIDIFYADNVLEHLFRNELDETLKLLYRKMKKGGEVIAIIPNRYTGPHDISKYFVPRGSEAEGLHFSEMRFAEFYDLTTKMGWKYKTAVFQLLKGPFFCLKDGKGKKTLRKAKWEPAFGNQKSRFLQKFWFKVMAYSVYVMEK